MCRSTFTSTRLTLNLPTLPLSVPPSVLEERRNSTLSVLAWTQADEDEMSGPSLAKNPQLVWMLSNEKKKHTIFFSFPETILSVHLLSPTIVFETSSFKTKQKALLSRNKRLKKTFFFKTDIFVFL